MGIMQAKVKNFQSYQLPHHLPPGRAKASAGRVDGKPKRPALHLNKSKVEPFDGLGASATTRRTNTILPSKLNLSHISIHTPPKYRIAFDIDDTLMCMLGDLSNALRFPPSHIMPVQGALYYIFPDFEKVFITLLCWGWGVDFFSLGTQMRNHELVPLYLKTLLLPYHPSSIAATAAAAGSGESGSRPSSAIEPASPTSVATVAGCNHNSGNDRNNEQVLFNENKSDNIISRTASATSSEEDARDVSVVFDTTKAGAPTVPTAPNSPPSGRSTKTPSPTPSPPRVIKLTRLSDIPAGHGIHATYSKICRFGRFRIFSRHQAIHIFGTYIKDLRIMTSDTSNTILIDDDRAYAAKTAGQLPFIGVCYRDPVKNNQLGRNLCIEEGGENIEAIYGYNPLDNAAYIMGVLLYCKDVLDAGDASTLRGALDMVLRHRGRSMISKDTAGPGTEVSRWFLQPYREYELAKLMKMKLEDLPYHRIKQKFIERGKEHFKKYF